MNVNPDPTITVSAITKNSDEQNDVDSCSILCECGSTITTTCEFHKKNHKDLWDEIIKEYDDKRKEIEDYIEAKKGPNEEPEHPEVAYLNDTVFDILNSGLIELLHISKKQEEITLTEGEPYFDALNFLSEYLWNMNPQYPERKYYWTDIRDIMWGCGCNRF